MCLWNTKEFNVNDSGKGHMCYGNYNLKFVKFGSGKRFAR